MSETDSLSPTLLEPRLARFVDLYQVLNSNTLDQLETVYANDIHFVDALHEVQGLEALKRYFAAMYANVNSCRFDIQHAQVQADTAFLSWQMHYSHRSIKGGQTIVVDGASQLSFRDQHVYFHRDYLDAGQMLYEHIPLLGGAIRLLKKRVS